ncbi:MAG TPA: hypothetical protein EYQ27_06125 [Gemmatimonadetes bacterium]|nr:hypothetical protein [Gemmatimonadota bacterium]
MSPGEAGRIILLDLSTDEDTVLVEPGFDAHYLESGHLIHGGCDGQVRAALFDPESSEIVEPVVVLDSVKIEPLFGSMVLTADSYGTVVRDGNAWAEAPGGQLKAQTLASLLRGRRGSLPAPSVDSPYVPAITVNC